jgi:uncharacterized protein
MAKSLRFEIYTSIYAMIYLNQIKNYPAPGRMLSFLVVLILLWLPGLALIYGVMSNTQNMADPRTQNLVTILTMGLLAIEFMILLPWWGRQVYQHPNLFYRYGLVLTRKNGLLWLKGLAIGWCATAALYLTQWLCGWGTWQSPSLPLWQLVLESIPTMIGVGLAEELFFRGWMLDELERDYAPQVALVSNASLFAFAHFLKPIPLMLQSLPQFPGLFLMGVVMIIAKRQHGNLLGIPIGIHGGMIWAFYLVSVGKIFKHSDKVSDWITGIGGNPICGLLGLIFMTGLVIILAKFPKQ